MTAPPSLGTQNDQRTVRPSTRGLRIAGIGWILLVAAGAIALEKPRRVVPASAPAAEFSAERAMVQVREIARAPHPVGSAEHARVRDYLLAQLEAVHLEPTVQRTTSILAAYGTAATVENIVAVKRGRGGGSANAARNAVLLAAHYDSVPAGPGAGDDGAGVATLLETARALSAGPPLSNDVIFLFSDGEELGLLGAAAFVAEHPWKNRAGVALNFDNRGTSGSVVMYETGGGNLALMREFASTVPSPRASSLAGAVSERMPNSSDFFVFRKAGMAGLNFAFIAGPENYHTLQDVPANLALATLQQAGDYALSLVRRLGDSDLPALAGAGRREAVYFNVADLEVVYPRAWAVPLSIAGVLLFLGVAAAGAKCGAFCPGGTIRALSICLVNLLAAWRAADWLAMSLARGAGNNPLVGAAGPYLFHPLYLAALGCVVAGITLALWEISGIGWADVALAGGFVWALLGVVLSIGLPSASYLAFWAQAPVLVATVCVFLRRSGPRAAVAALLWLAAVPAVMLIAPLLPTLHLALGMTTLGAAALAILFVLALWLLAPIVGPVGGRSASLAFFFLAAGVACVAGGVWTIRYDARHPRPEWMAYVLDSDHSEAHWMSRTDGQTNGLDMRLDSWRRQYLGDQPRLTNFPVALGPRGGMLAWEHEAPFVEFAAPEATLLEETQQDNTRTLRLRLLSARHAARLSIQAKAAAFDSVQLNGHLVGDPLPAARVKVRSGLRMAGERETWSMLYAAPPEDGLEAIFVIPAGEPLELSLGDISDGIPEIPGHTFAPRPPEITQQHFADGTVVLKRFTF